MVEIITAKGVQYWNVLKWDAQPEDWWIFPHVNIQILHFLSCAMVLLVLLLPLPVLNSTFVPTGT